MTRALSHDDPLDGLPSRARIAELILGSRPPLDTYAGWQHYRTHYDLLVPAPTISPQQWSMLPEPGSTG
ncbi:hypothetical protein [Streptomyces mirabilis]|uniref:hypothetical protein n=1 Tax=Streptomyces mirabilis TaxID=68239 RepID=UPI0038118A34